MPELKAIDSDDDAVSITDEVTRLQQKAQQALVDTYAKLTPWQKTQVARHPDRPHCLDYVSALIEVSRWPAIVISQRTPPSWAGSGASGGVRSW